MNEKQPRFKHPQDESEAHRLLDQYSIPYLTWGTGSAKRLEDLEREVAEGETVLELEKGKLVRKVEVITLDVVYEDKKGVVWELFEARQEFADGRVRQRKIESSMGEKIKQGEDRDEAALRAIKEELGQEVMPEAGEFQGTSEATGESESYPGLQSRIKFHRYLVHFSESQVVLDENGKPRGYVEQQPEKTTYFEWRQREQN